MSGHKLLDEPTFYQRPDARRDEVETQAGGNFEEENAMKIVMNIIIC